MNTKNLQAHESSGNRLLDALPLPDRRDFLPLLQSVDLTLRQVLEEPNVRIDHVYFVQHGLVSIVATTERDRIEVGMVGCEGMTGLNVVLGGDRSTNLTLVQAAGSALRITAPSLRAVLSSSPAIACKFQQYVQIFMSQASGSVIANGKGRLSERLARWILMWHDRIGGDLHITHDFLSLLMGVRRPGVTTAMHELEGARLIRATRGSVQVLDREGLLQAARGFYGVPEREYDRLISPLMLERELGRRYPRDHARVPA